MNAEIISIGTELLLGHIVDTNAPFISRHLAAIGVDLFRRVTVGDNPDRLLEALKTAAGRSDVVIATGGLGPTVDDVTYATVGRLLDRPLVLNRSVLKEIKAYFSFRRLPVPAETIRQAYLPLGVPSLVNKVGSAPGLVVDYKGKLLIFLPGPPREIEPMFIEQVMPLLKKRWALRQAIRSRTIKIVGLGESQVDGRVRDLLELKPPTTVGIYAKLGQVELKIMSKEKTAAKAKLAIARVERTITKRLDDHIFGFDDETLESVVAGLLTRKRLTIAVAESCTGGFVTHRLTNVGGSSSYLAMSAVTYSNRSKEKLLGVSHISLAGYGAVSREVAVEMAYGIKRLADADIGLALTGIAGPTGGTTTKPVGLVHIALALPKGHLSKEYRFRGTREEVKHLASQMALDLVRRSV